MLEVASAKIDRFGWDRMSDAIKDQLCKDWVTALGKYRLDEVKLGIEDFFASQRGNVRSINEHQVIEMISKRHANELALLPSAPVVISDRERVSAEAAERIMQEAGFERKSGTFVHVSTGDDPSKPEEQADDQ